MIVNYDYKMEYYANNIIIKNIQIYMWIKRINR